MLYCYSNEHLRKCLVKFGLQSIGWTQFRFLEAFPYCKSRHENKTRDKLGEVKVQCGLSSIPYKHNFMVKELVKLVGLPCIFRILWFLHSQFFIVTVPLCSGSSFLDFRDELPANLFSVLGGVPQAKGGNS